jgi:hypothetical protein
MAGQWYSSPYPTPFVSLLQGQNLFFPSYDVTSAEALPMVCALLNTNTKHRSDITHTLGGSSVRATYVGALTIGLPSIHFGQESETLTEGAYLTLDLGSNVAISYHQLRWDSPAIL